MARRALLVGIDSYDTLPTLESCVADAVAMRDVLETNEDGSANYDCRLLCGTEDPPDITRELLQAQWEELFGGFRGDVLFYFSGHGALTRSGGYIATQDGLPAAPGLPMDDLLHLANTSPASSALLILDCCHSGALGNPTVLQGNDRIPSIASIREGVTILAAAGPQQTALAAGGHGVFTKLLLGALSGGAADVRGRVSAAAIYAYVEQSLGSWGQRPLYKSNADHLPPVRLCEPAVPDSLLRELPAIFPQADSQLRLAPSFEFTHPEAREDHVALFDKLKLLRNARLLTTEEQKDLFFLALDSGRVKLTPLGQFYWDLAKQKRLGRP